MQIVSTSSNAVMENGRYYTNKVGLYTAIKCPEQRIGHYHNDQKFENRRYQ